MSEPVRDPEPSLDSTSSYRLVAPKIDLPQMEREVLEFWEQNDIFGKTLTQSEGKPKWVFYEGPPTANGNPGAHHVEARVFKDVFPRYKTMQGHFVPRKAGWDCHGLPVELAVEKQLGFNGKPDIEEYGIAEFNEKCRESVLSHVDEFEEMTRRMGYWVDMDSAYWTMDADYIQSVWWSLKKIFDAGLLVEDQRVAPYCPRCGTGLSDHEVAQGYEDIVDPSIYVRFPLTSGAVVERHPGATMLVWTTTPWTLVSNTAVAVNPEAEYAVVRQQDSDETYVVATNLVEQVLGDGSEILETFPGTELERAQYERPFDLIEIPDSHFVLLADYVTIDDGTGLVHQAPAFGADDLAACREYGLPVVNPIAADGTFKSDVPLVAGKFFKDADATLVEDLESRGKMFRLREYEHSYPHCWRCHTPLMYYAQPSWYIRTTQIKDRLIAENEKTNWFPETIKHGRFGDWLNNNIDWALSRNRYWGTPLPIWRCPEGHLTAVGSMEELSQLAGTDVSTTDPHRPFVDDITIACAECGETANRVPEVIDCWYDSGAMPFAQFGYPRNNVEEFETSYPADFICEAIDQTRGWFYTLLAVGELANGASPYKNVLCLGHILDEKGEKMSKHKGNVLEPIPLMEDHGADALRWFMVASGSAWQARRLGHQAIVETVRKTLLTYWNTASFLSLYGRIAEFDPLNSGAAAPSERQSLDRWALALTNQLIIDVTSAMDEFNTQSVGRLLTDYVDDLSNWYVRRSRRRFWDGEPNALATLHECMTTLTLLMAPLTPFITERVWSDLFHSTDPSLPPSVHMATWPEADARLLDRDLLTQVDLVRRVVDLGRTARSESQVKTRQPLGRALISAAGWQKLPQDLVEETKSELNVLALEPLDVSDSELLSITVKPNFRELGKRFAKQTPLVAKAITEADPAELADKLRAHGAAEVAVDGADHQITPEDVSITESPKEGWAVAQESGEAVALDLEINDELAQLGVARDLVREVQEARKNNGFEVTDRISITWSSSNDQVRAAMANHGGSIADDVLATSVEEVDSAVDLAQSSENLNFSYTLERQ